MTRKQSIGRSTSKAKRIKKYREDLENRTVRYAVTNIQEISHLSESKEINNSNYTFFKGIKFNNQPKQLSSLVSECLNAVLISKGHCIQLARHVTRLTTRTTD